MFTKLENYVSCRQRDLPIHRHLVTWVKQVVASIGVITLLTVLSGCAAMSESQCASTDWEYQGETDGQKGKPMSELSRYSRSCGEFGITPDAQAYRTGRERGLQFYCTDLNGYEIGRTGSGHRSVCPTNLAMDFRKGYEIGRDVYVALNAMRDTVNSINSAQDRISRIKSKIRDKQSALDDSDTTAEDKKRIENEIDGLKREIKDKEDQIKRRKIGAAVLIGNYNDAASRATRAGFDESRSVEILIALQKLI